MGGMTGLLEKSYFYPVNHEASGDYGSLLFHTRGDGLYPLIRDGDILHIDPTGSDFHVGDLALFESQRGQLCIRLFQADIMVQNGARPIGKVAEIDRNGQTKGCDDRFTRFCHITYFLVRPLILCFLAMRKMLSLCHPRFFVKDPESSLRAVAQKFNEEEEVRYYSQQAFEGLDEKERGFVGRHMQRRGRVLNIGCGPGREAFALAELGFEVIGIDVAPRMIEAAGRIAASRGQEIRFEVKSATNLDYHPHSFDYVFMSEGIYSLIPTRDLRIDVLRKIGKLLAPDGILLFSALYRRASILSRVSLYNVFRRIAMRYLGRRLHAEPGDTLVRYVSPASKASTLCYVHLFAGAGEVREEVSSAGLDGLEDTQTGYWVVRPLKVGNVQGGIGEEAA